MLINSKTMEKQVLELMPEYGIILKSVDCVIDECTLNVHQILPDGEIDETIKFNLLEMPDHWVESLSLYDIGLLNKIIDQQITAPDVVAAFEVWHNGETQFSKLYLVSKDGKERVNQFVADNSRSFATLHRFDSEEKAIIAYNEYLNF